jgi:hypothetical protein
MMLKDVHKLVSKACNGGTQNLADLILHVFHLKGSHPVRVLENVLVILFVHAILASKT